MKQSHIVSNRTFGLLFALLFAVIASVAWLAFDVVLFWAVGVSAVFLVSAVTVPGVLLPLNRVWRVVARGLSCANNYILLGLFYYLLIVPTGVIFRILRRDPMDRFFDTKAKSYWTSIERQGNAEAFRDLF